MASVLQFEETPPNANIPSGRAICLDCEMCFTVYGMELIRMTATAWPGGEDVLDVLVRPMGEILDLNTRFSGITPQQLASARPYNEDTALRTQNASTDSTNTNSTKPPSSLPIVSSPAAARALLYTQISPETTIIGHALENDLGATRLIHPHIVDSALLFPHRFGLPYRNSLKMLARRHLDIEIQAASLDIETGTDASGGIVGHDSKEDAKVAGELIRCVIFKEWKRMERDGWCFDLKGKLIAPADLRDRLSSSGGSKIQTPNAMQAQKYTAGTNGEGKKGGGNGTDYSETNLEASGEGGGRRGGGKDGQESGLTMDGKDALEVLH